MMDKIWIYFNKTSDTDAIVTSINYVPNDPINGIPPDKQNLGIFVDSIPEPTPATNQTYELHINPSTLQFSYVYIDIPKSQEQIIADLQLQLKATNEAIADLSVLIATPQTT